MSGTADENDGMLEMSAIEIQQEYYEAVADADWELYEKEDKKYLLQKIAIALCGPPKTAGDLVNNSNEIKLKGYDLRDEEQTMTVFNKICEQTKYSHNNENIYVSVIRVVCVSPSEVIPLYKPDPDDYWLDLHDKKGKSVTICIFHVFGVRKCISTKVGHKSCRKYIDHEGRVYQNWEAYLTNNKLPKNVMIVPKNGEYKAKLSKYGVVTLNNDGKTTLVDLTVVPTPALGITARILTVTDTVSTVANIGALAGFIVGAVSLPLMPVIAPVAFGAAGATAIVTGVYGIARSSIHLADRGQHEQPIGLDNAEARGSWLNITLSAAGISFSAAGKLLSMAASTGTDIKIFINAFQVLKYANLVTGFIGVANSLGEMIYKFYKYDETPTTLELFQFTSSALFFGLGVMSNQTAKDIVQDAQAKTINDARDSLSSNNKRKSFDKATAETRRLKGTIDGNADVIKALNKIKNKDEFFAKLRTANKDMNKNKVRVSLSPDGEALFNNKQKISISDFGKLGKKGRNQLFSEYGPAKVTSKNVPTRIYPSNASTSRGFNTPEKDFSIYITTENLVKVSTFVLRFSQMDKEFIAEILSQISEELHNAFILICAELFHSLLSDFGVTGYENYIVRLVYFVFNYIKSRRVLGNSDYDNDNAFTIIVKEFLQDGGIRRDTFLRLKHRFLQWISNSENDVNIAFDDIRKFKEMFSIQFKIIEAGKVMTIGIHHILIKESTVNLLSELFETYEQNKCDLFTKFCFALISKMSPGEVSKLSLVNPDEDLLMIVAKILIEKLREDHGLLEDFSKDDINEFVLKYFKCKMLDWLSCQTFRPHTICITCKGICYG